MRQTLRWHVYPSAEALYTRAAQAIARIAREAIAMRGAFYVVLAGGETPLGVYERLRAAETEWPAWHVYFGDERCLPRGHPGRNDTRIAQVWLDHVPIPRPQIHAMPAECGPELAAVAYARLTGFVGDFDLVLLGLGEDGHTASLFPGHPLGEEEGAADVLAVTDAPKPPPARVSLSVRRLSRAREVLFLVQGEAKRTAVAAWRRGERIPAAAIVPAAGVDVLLDVAAGGWHEN
jgi:6-phosphogluconolactonase